MEDLNTPEEQEFLNEDQSEETSKTDSIECPNCKDTKKVVFETMRRTESYKVKPFEIMACKNCGTIFCDIDTLEDIF